MRRSDEAPGVLAAARTIVWAFLGIGHRHGEPRTVRLRPTQIVVAGILGGALFVLVLIALVRTILRAHGAPG